MNYKFLNLTLITNNSDLTVLRICQQCYNFSGEIGLTVLNVSLIINCYHPQQTVV